MKTACVKDSDDDVNSEFHLIGEDKKEWYYK